MNKTIMGVIGVAVLIGGGWYYTTQPSSKAAQMNAEEAAMEAEKQQMEEKAMMEKAAMEEASTMNKDESMMKDETMMKDDMMKTDEVMVDEATGAMTKTGTYVAYDTSKLAMAETGDVVLFFKASWCPSCRAVDADIKANSASIPADLTILEVDYDTSAALKQQYGVTTQHTFVQVDASGALIKKWSGGSTLASIVAAVE